MVRSVEAPAALSECAFALCPVLCRAPVPVPAVLREGVSEADLKRLAEKGTVYVNKGLGELAHRWLAGSWAAWGAALAC